MSDKSLFKDVTGENALNNVFKRASELGVHMKVINCKYEKDPLCSHITKTGLVSDTVKSEFKTALGSKFYSGQLQQHHRLAVLSHELGKLAAATAMTKTADSRLKDMATSCHSCDNITDVELHMAQQLMGFGDKLAFACEGRHLPTALKTLDSNCRGRNACENKCLYSGYPLI